MTSLEKLDAVLQTIIDLRFKEHITAERLFKMHDKIGVEFGEVFSILKKLEKDEYLDVVKTKIPDTNDYSVFYNVNFSGLVFNEQGGYAGQVQVNNELTILRQRQHSLQVQNRNLTILVAVGTTVAAVYYGIEVWKFFCNSHQP